MVTTAFSVFGNCRTERLVSARRPSTRISRLTVMASTGRRMKMSVKFIGAASFFLRRWIGAVRRLHAVVDDERRAVLQLDGAACHHRRTRLDALENRDLVAAPRTRSDEHLLGNDIGGRLPVLLSGALGLFLFTALGLF